MKALATTLFVISFIVLMLAIYEVRTHADEWWSWLIVAVAVVLYAAATYFTNRVYVLDKRKLLSEAGFDKKQVDALTSRPYW